MASKKISELETSYEIDNNYYFPAVVVDKNDKNDKKNYKIQPSTLKEYVKEQVQEEFEAINGVTYSNSNITGNKIIISKIVNGVKYIEETTYPITDIEELGKLSGKITTIDTAVTDILAEILGGPTSQRANNRCWPKKASRYVRNRN